MNKIPQRSAQILNLGSEDPKTSYDVADDADTLYWSTPEFRAVPLKSGRKGIKLERAFWHTLNSISERMGKKRTLLIEEVLQEASSKGVANTTSALRSYAANHLLEEIDEVQEKSSIAFIIRVMQQAPVPSLAVDRERRLLQVNREFSQLVRDIAASADDAEAMNDAQLLGKTRVTIRPAVAPLFKEIEDTGQPRECQISVQVGIHVRHRRMRVVGVPAGASEALVGFVTP